MTASSNIDCPVCLKLITRLLRRKGGPSGRTPEKDHYDRYFDQDRRCFLALCEKVFGGNKKLLTIIPIVLNLFRCRSKIGHIPSLMLITLSLNLTTGHIFQNLWQNQVRITQRNG